ncbi:long-chain-fatty-acid--CoA ligase [Nocardia sp. CDC159]|uniref:Long-chain-fatty-acid--CoA ligase n=1 Tax=Nocardia pulmonis TaxID=2951408 RepID=A0A9X2E6P1_9NOCA|nr:MULTISPECIES: long-chain-fatty-acid--CoA ligase [Nocardia]MCM6772498.1 long-chain-fatty-acid--CoA ligase [Nocardia pulmonis]MCM6784844.1 long-chain-fatty-acid--CoA ligase [Nocardia sp. CDC159]
MSRTLAELTRGHDPAATAVVCGARTMTYGDLDRAADRIAAGLSAAGLAPGARVAYLGLESVDYYATLLGCARSATVLVPINFRLTPEEIGHILADSRAEVLIADASLRARLDLGSTIRCLDTESFAEWYGGQPAEPPELDLDADTPVVQLYTSGTTGLPKGVVLAHRSFFAVRAALAAAGEGWIDWRAGDIGLIGIPGFHVGGIWWATQGLGAGATMVAMPRFDPATAVELIRERAISTVCVVPSMLRLMLAEPGADRAALASVRKLVYGGSPISESLLGQAMSILDCEFAQIYGLTETGNTAVCLPPDQHYPGSPRLQAAGRAYPGFAIRVSDERGDPLGPGRVGEVWLRTPGHMVEYWRRPDATAATLVDGWIRTGDAGYLDDEGYLFLCDRLQDMIIVGGENIYPAEVENVIAGHPAVADVAVVGAPDERFGERVHAFVAARAEVSARELFVHCTDRLAGYKIPSRFEFVERVPRNPSGKILRRQLREPLWPSGVRRIG